MHNNSQISTDVHYFSRQLLLLLAIMQQRFKSNLNCESEIHHDLIKTGINLLMQNSMPLHTNVVDWSLPFQFEKFHLQKSAFYFLQNPRVLHIPISCRPILFNSFKTCFQSWLEIEHWKNKCCLDSGFFFFFFGIGHIQYHTSSTYQMFEVYSTESAIL